MTSLHIGHVIQHFLPGSQTFIATQLCAQPDLRQTVFTRNVLPGTTFLHGEVVELDRRAAGGLLGRVVRRAREHRLTADPFSCRLAGAVRDRHLDLLHAHFGWRGLDALPAARASGLPLITAFHGRDVYSPRHRPGGAGGLYDELFASGTFFTCVGPRARDEIVRSGCPRERVRIVPVGINLDEFPYSPRAVDGEIIVLQVARLVPKKGVDLSIRAFAGAAVPRSRLVIAGDGPERRALERLSRQLGVEDRVEFRGAVRHDEVRRLMRGADVGIQPSRVGADGDREGTPTVIIEMQALGVSVVATRHADIPWIVPHPESLAEEEDVAGLSRALQDVVSLSPRARRSQTDAARALIEDRHDARRVATVLRNVYADALDDTISR